ncbi:hypothetical protein HLASF_1127 [Halanaeroarchaeum sulfurireducens]|uniref:Uncharacterized protein n=1 Tax=Halanaeroarchaeum sulfurireducens TaxID=1604004 RepID=A0A0F7PBT3_9EURY|nr:hypothetical protein HLASF_1127 [Halanaeroarchaeum sulfurireducens]
MIEGLARFDTPTGFAVGVNSVTATLNNRKQTLVDLGVINKIGLQQDGIRFTDDGSLVVGGMALAEINATLEKRGLGKLTIIPTSTFRRAMGRKYVDLCETAVKVINPAPIPRFLGDKAMQYWELYDTALAVPPWQPIDYYLSDGGEPTMDALAEDFIADAPLVLKARASTQGRGIWFYPGGVDGFLEDWATDAAPDPFLDAPEQFLLQYAVPHRYDKRVIAAGRTPISGENRFGDPNTDKSNLNIVDTGASTLRDATATLLERGAVEPMDMPGVDPAVERAVADLHDELAALAAQSSDRLHTWIGWDLLVVDPDDSRLEAVPDDVLQGLLKERYRTERGEYLVFGEGNLSPGSKERYVNALTRGREGLRWDSAANLLAYGRSVSRSGPFEPGIPDLIDREALANRYGL